MTDRGGAGRRLAPLLLLVLAGLFYANALQNDFCIDDRPMIVESEAIRKIAYGNWFRVLRETWGG